MSDISHALGEYLRRRHDEKNREEGRSYEDPLTWRELSLRMDVPETSLIRWKGGLNAPANPEHIAALASEFGTETLVVLGLIDEDTLLFIDNKNDPDIRRVIQSIREKSKERDRGLLAS